MDDGPADADSAHLHHESSSRKTSFLLESRPSADGKGSEVLPCDTPCLFVSSQHFRPLPSQALPRGDAVLLHRRMLEYAERIVTLVAHGDTEEASRVAHKEADFDITPSP